LSRHRAETEIGSSVGGSRSAGSTASNGKLIRGLIANLKVFQLAHQFTNRIIQIRWAATLVDVDTIDFSIVAWSG
jgi:hypothetical protein